MSVDDARLHRYEFGLSRELHGDMLGSGTYITQHLSQLEMLQTHQTHCS